MKCKSNILVAFVSTFSLSFLFSVVDKNVISIEASTIIKSYYRFGFSIIDLDCITNKQTNTCAVSKARSLFFQEYNN